MYGGTKKMTVADRIKTRREELMMSQDELAARLHLKGRSSVCKAEKSGNSMTLKTVKAYAEALGCTPGYLMGWEEEAEPTEDNGYFLGSLMHDSTLLDYIKKITELNDEDKEALYKYIDFLSSK